MNTNPASVLATSTEPNELGFRSAGQRLAHRLGLPSHSLWYFVSIAASFLIIFGQSVYAAKSLGPALYGIWNIFAITYSYGLLAHCGVLNGLAREVPKAIADGDESEAQQLMQSAFWVNVGGTVLFSGLALLILRTVFRATAQVTWFILLLFIVFLLLQGWTNFLLFAFRACDQFNVLSAFTVALNGGVLVGAFAFMPRWNLMGFVLAWAVAYSVVSIVFLNKTPHTIWIVPSIRSTRHLLRIGMPILLFVLASTINWTMDRLLIARYLGVTAVGHFAVAAFAVRLLTYVPEMVSQVMYPHWAASSLSRNSGRELSAAPFKMMFWIMPLLGGLAYYACFLIPVFLPSYRESVLPSQVLCLAASLMSVGLFCGGFLGASGNERLALNVQLVAILLRLILVGGAAAFGGTLLRVAFASGISGAAFGTAVLWVTACGLRSRWRFVVHGLLPWCLCTIWLLLIELARNARSFGRIWSVSLVPWAAVVIFLVGAVLIFLFLARQAGLRALIAMTAPPDSL